MQKSTDIEPKKDSKVESKTEKKDRIEKKAPFNKRDEDKESEKNSKADDGTINQNNPVNNGDEIETGKENDNDSVIQRSGRGIPNNDTKKLSKSQLDSLKAKQRAPLNTEEPDSTKK